MEENQNLVNLYNALSSKGVTSAKDIGEFKTLLDDEKNREELWKGLQEKGVFNGDYNEFQSNLGLTPAPRVDVSDVEAQQQPQVTAMESPANGMEQAALPTQQTKPASVMPWEANGMADYGRRLKGETRRERKERERREALLVDLNNAYAATGEQPYEPPTELSGASYNEVLQKKNALVAEKQKIDERGNMMLDTDIEPSWAEKDRNRAKIIEAELDKVLKYEYNYLRTPEGQAYLDRYDEMCNEMDAAIKEAGGDNYSWKGRLAQAFADVSPNEIKAFTPEEEQRRKDMADYGNKLIKAKRDVKNVRREVRMTRERLNGDYSGFRRGWRATDVEGLSGINDFADKMTQLELAKKVREGKPLDKVDEVLLRANELKSTSDMNLATSDTMWEHIGSSTAEQLVTTAEFLAGSYLTGATDISGKVAGRVMSSMGSKAAEEAVVSGARNLLRAGVAEVAGMAAGAAVQTFANPISYLSMMADYADKRTGTIYYDQNDGQLHYFDNNKSIALSLWQAAAGAYIENFTEFSGEGLDKIGKLGLNKLFSAAPELKSATETIKGLLDKVKFSELSGLNAPAMDDFLRHAGFNGTLGEFGEEVLGNIIRPFAYVETEKGESYGKQLGRGLKNLVDADQNLETFLSCAITSAVLGTVGTVRRTAADMISNRGQKAYDEQMLKDVRDNIAKLDAMMNGVRGLDKEAFKEFIANNNVSDISQYIKEQAKANNWTSDELGMVALYVTNVAQQNAMANQNSEAIQQSIDALNEQTKQLVNEWDGEHIYNVTFKDPKTGEELHGAVVNGRMHYTQNDDGTYNFNPYVSSGMLAIRMEDGSVRQVSSRAVTSLDNVTTAAEQNADQGQIVREMMEDQFNKDELMPTVESAWGFEFEPGATEIDGLTFVGKDKDGNYQFQMGSNANRVVKMSEEQVISWGLRQGISLMQQQAANGQLLNDISADVQKMSDDADLMDEIDQLKQQNTRGVTAHDLWKQVIDVTSKFVSIDENGLYDEDNTSPNDAAVDLYARSEGNVAAAKENVAKAKAALMSASQQGSLAAVGAFTGSALANQEAQVQSDEATTRAAKQIAFLEQVENVLDQMGARAQQLAENDAKEEAVKVSSTPVSQMEVGQQFPVEWRGQQAMATVMGKDANGRSVVTVRDINGEDIEAGIDDMSDAQWEAVRVQPQEATTPEQVTNNPKTLDDITDEDIPKREDGTVIYYEINDPMVYAKAALMEEGSVESALRMIDEDISGLQRDLKDSRYRERGEARLKLMEDVKRILLSLQQQNTDNVSVQPEPQPTPTPVQPEPAPIPTTSDVQPSIEIPRDKEGKAEYDKITDPYVYAAAVTEEFGDEAIDVVNALIESEEAALEGAKKIKDTIKRFREQRESKARLELFNKVKDIIAPQEQTETPAEETTPVEEVPTEQPTAETPVEEAPAEEAPAETPMESAGEGTEQTEEPEQAPEQPTERVPDWTEDTAKAARERGYRMVDGERVDRQEPIEGVEGNEVEVKFSDTEKPEGKWKVVEAESLQPSHLNKRRNPRFFITEAQPKERKDNASDEASTKIAKDINPEEVMQGVTAYSGSPVINSRGEVIQGNNRTIGLQKMYESYPESQEKYKQALMDKAEQMGLDKEAIGKMQHPVLVRSVDVDDDTAIKLGQKTSQDTESGGKQRMGASQVRNGLGDKYANLIEMLFADTTEDEGIGEAIARNGVTALKYLWNQKVINNTQYQSALENGDLTAEAKEDFRNIIMESLFEGGPDGLRTAFNMLPAKSQNAILQTIYRDAKSNEESKIKGEVQQAIMAFTNLMGFKSFAAAKNQTDVENAVNSWLGQQNMFSDVANTEKYTNFALELAKRFKWQTLTGQRAFFNELYDKLQGVASEGLSMFEEVQQLGLAEAIKAVYGIDYLKPQQNNGISGSNVVANDNGTRQEGEQGRTGETESGEREESGERPADDRGGDERTDREGQKTESGEKVEEASEVAPEDIETTTDPTATETIVEKGLTEEEVDAAEGIDTQTKLLAKEYIKGNKNELTKDAYEEVREYYAERGRRNPEQDSRTASGTQLASADNETADQRSGGQRRVEPGRVDRGGSEETLSEDGRRGEDSEEQPSATAGEQSVDSGNGEQLGTVGQPADSGDATGGSRNRSNGHNVRQPRGQEESSGVSGTGARGQSGTSKRRSTDEIDKDIADDLAAISSLFKEFVADQKKMGIAANQEEQAKADIAWFRNVRKAIFKLAGHVFERGYTQFDEWKNKIKDLLHSAIKNFREKLSDERLDQLLADAWECPFEYNGEVKTIREWASELHAAEVRKMLSKSIEEKRKEQEEANKRHIKQVHGDLNNIKETLPFLLPHQQENVAKAERQFFSEEHADREHGYGKGYCFTDGTGTGKTFTGLGIARRFVNEGKGRILILTTKTKVNDWVADGAKMGLDVTSLEAGAKKAGKTPTEFKGSGIVCTTYANARQNKALLEDTFDLVIYDESHYIMNNKGGEETISTKSHYMLTNKNIENALARLQENHPLWIKEQELVEERQQQEEIINKDDASYAAQQAASQIDGQLKQIKEQQKAELPAMREKAAEAAKITKSVFLSATPFKSIDNLEYAEGYLFSYPEEDPNTKGSSDHRSGKDEFKLRFFGSKYRWRHHQIEEHVQNLDAAVQQQQAFADRLMNTLGTMSGVVLDNGYDYSRHFPLVEVAMADQFNSAVEAINRDPALRVLGEYFPFDDYQKMSVLFETMKVAAMLPRIKEHLAKGRKVVIFNRRTKYPQPTPTHPNPWVPQNPFTEGLATAIATAKQSDPNKADVIMNAVNLFQERYNSLIAWADKLDYRLPAEQLKDAFGDKIEVINGKVTGKKRQAIIDKFNRDDDQGLDLLLGQEITMREGISIHDTTGNKQRVVMSLALPQETTTFIQGEGRIYRIGNKSNAIFEYPLLGINRELQLFALSFNAAVGVTENLAMGSSARNLARSIAKGVMEDSGVVPLDNQGVGGREKDYGKSTRDAYSSAINDYYSNQKQKAGRENRLGEDYYATPEPLGFKMVQWLNLAEGEEVLEPSAGHGAIARYFPNNVRSLAIEPSDALFTMLALNTGGVDKDNAAQASGKNKFVQNGTFEDLKTVNKYDAIAMNPPFGHAGATAIEHLDKAWQHLRNSGRIAIIVPTGAMDKKMEKWFDEHKNAVVVGEIKLPSVTFQQAGTSVSTRMLLIDRVDRASFRSKVAAKKVSLDLTGVQNIDEFFRELRDVDMPSRMIDPATKLLRHGDALRTKLSGNDMVDYKRNPQTDRRSKNMGKDMTVGEEGVRIYLSSKANGMNFDHYYSQSATWNDIKKLRGKSSTFFNAPGYVFLSDLAKCETYAEAKDKRLMDKWNSTQETFEQAKEFAEAMTDFMRRVTGFTDEQIRDYAAGKVDLFDYTKIKDNAQLTFQDLTRRYEDMEQDPMLQALFEQVSTIAERIGMKIETFNDPYTTVMGSYNPLTNTLRINSGRWNNPSESDSAKSQTILHELIHSVTSYALNAYDKGLPMSEGLKEACRRTYEIFENIKGDYPSYYGNTQVFAPSDAPKEARYGFANTHEMLSEMANPTFRKYLQKKGLWKKLVDGIKRILNYLGLQNLGMKFTQNMDSEQYRRWYGTDKENVETATNAGWVATNAFDELSETLDMFLDNFDAALYERRNDGIVRAKMVENDDLYRDQEREYEFGETLPIKKDADGRYRVEGLNDSYPNLDRLLDAWRDEHLDYFAEIRNGKLYIEPWNLPEPKTAKEKRYLQKSRERAWRNMHTKADDTIKKLGLQDRVTILDSTDGLEGKKKTAKGWFDPATGKIVIVMPNHRDPHDVMKTILHEGVAHYGLRQLVGNDNMNEFLDKVFEHASKDVRDRIIDLAMNKYNRNIRKATEEYLAGLAESTNFEDATEKDWFKKIKAWFMQMLHKVGIDFGNFGEAVDNATFWGDRFTDNELRYLLWKSYRNIVADAESRTELARDVMMQSQLGVGNYAPQTVAAESMAMESPENGTEQDDILFRDAEPQNKIADEYNRMTGANVQGVNDVKRGWEQFARGMFDDMRPLEQMQNLIQKALGRELRDSEKAYELATQLVSKTGRQIYRENLDYMVPMLQQVTSAIRSLMEAEGLSREEAYDRVNNYLLAKHGLERNEWFIKQGKKEGDYAGLRGLAENLGENPDDYKAVAERVVNEFEQEVDTKDLWKSMKALTDRMLEISYETGMIDKDTYEDLKQRYKNYVPLRGFAEGTASDLFDYVSQSPHYQNILKTAKGRKSMADDPLGNLMNMLQSAIVIGNQNQVMQKIYNLAVNGKSDLLRISKPWYVYNDTTDTWEEKFPDIPEDATADEIDAIMKQFDADMQQLKAQGKAKQKRNRLEVGKKILPAEAREHRMIAYINGQKVAMHVAGNPLVAQAMNRMNTQHLNKVMQGIQSATRWYSSINTSWSPAFGPKNANKDARMMLFSAYVTGGVRKMMRAQANIIRAGWVLPRLIVTGKMDKGITKMISPKDAAQLEQWWNEFLDNGGETGFTRTLNAEKAKAEVKDMVRHMLNGSKDGENRVRKYTLGLLEKLGQYSEDITRFAAYCMQRAQGESVLNSINEAKNVTVNFNVHGGSDLAANMRAMYSFFNASMQGINRMRRLATEHPDRFSAGIATLMLGGAVLPWLNMAMFALLGGDDDDWRKYEELTEYTANNNMILYVGNHKFLSIPWSQELAPFNALGNIWFRQQMGWNKGKSVAEQWGDMFVDLSPVSVASGKKPGVGLVKTIMPSFTTPVWEAIFNEDFTGSPLYKDNQWNKYDAAWEKAYAGKTSQSVIDASRWLNEKTDIDINPAIAEHLFSGVLGGMGRSGDKLLRYFTNGFQLQDAPFIRTMMFDSNPKGYMGAVQREYGRNAYDVLDKVKHDVENMDAMEFARFSQTEEFEIANLVSIYKTGKDLAGNKRDVMGIDKMEKEYKKLAGMSDGSEEYREHLEAIKADITEYKMELLDEIEQIKYEHSGEVTLDNLFGLRKRIIDRVNEVERESKEKNARRNG
jgi:hypothetical protein